MAWPLCIQFANVLRRRGDHPTGMFRDPRSRCSCCFHRRRCAVICRQSWDWRRAMDVCSARSDRWRPWRSETRPYLRIGHFVGADEVAVGDPCRGSYCCSGINKACRGPPRTSSPSSRPDVDAAAKGGGDSRAQTGAAWKSPTSTACFASEQGEGRVEFSDDRPDGNNGPETQAPGSSMNSGGLIIFGRGGGAYDRVETVLAELRCAD
jgi:hypothetical protein